MNKNEGGNRQCGKRTGYSYQIKGNDQRMNKMKGGIDSVGREPVTPIKSKEMISEESKL
jgi:hypothetical protein